ncbi:MAG TPA: alpha/beta hydrolase [Oculatellaceae cyanobacterium]
MINSKNRRPLMAAMLSTTLISAASAARGANSGEESPNHNGGDYVLVDDARLHYVESGSGQPLILLHGNDGTAQDFTMSIFDQLARKYRTLAFDRPGHGNSENPSGVVATPEVQARMLHDALQKLNVVHPVLVAHSWSGSLALSYALQYPGSIRGLVLFGAMAYGTKTDVGKPIYYMGQMPILGTMFGTAFKAVGRTVVERLLRQAFMPDQAPQDYVDKFLKSTLRLSQLRAFVRDQMYINPALRKMSPHYSSITVPVVIVTGDADRTVSPKSNSFHLHKAIPSSRLIVLHNAGHQLQFTRPAELLSAIDLVTQTATVGLDTASAQASQISPDATAFFAPK